jgi:hypothetical protein
MTTFLAQIFSVALNLPIVVAMLMIARSATPALDPRHRTSWWITAVCFALLTVSLLLHQAGASWAYFSDPDSAVWTHFLRWMPVANHGRSGLVLGLGAALLIASRPHDAKSAGVRRAAIATLLAGLALGSAIGWREGPVTGEGGAHAYAIAILHVAEFSVLLFAIGYAVAVDSIDRLLLMVLCLYTSLIAFSVGFFSAAAWVDVPGSWIPSQLGFFALGSAIKLLMLAVAVHKYRLLRRGEPAPALLAARPAGTTHISFFA